MSRPNGGAAFPHQFTFAGPGKSPISGADIPAGSVHTHSADGMTLRDYLAAKAMQGICAHHDTWGIATETTVAQQAYAVADAMLAARGAA